MVSGLEHLRGWIGFRNHPAADQVDLRGRNDVAFVGSSWMGPGADRLLIAELLHPRGIAGSHARIGDADHQLLRERIRAHLKIPKEPRTCRPVRKPTKNH